MNSKNILLSETRLEQEKAKLFLEEAVSVIDSIEHITVENLHDNFYALAEKLNSKPGELFKLIRITLVGGTTAPGLFETMDALGKESTLRRIRNMSDKL